MKRFSTVDVPSMAPAKLLPLVIDTVIKAGTVVRAGFHRTSGRSDQRRGGSLDQLIESLLRERLQQIHTCDWHGEELPHEKVGTSDMWVVDPIDGTSAFERGIRGASISVALLRYGKPVLGVVYSPVAPDDAGDLFCWAQGLPACRNGQVLKPIGPRPAHYPFEALEDAAASWPPEASAERAYGHDTIIGMNENADQYAVHNAKTFAPASVMATASIAYRLCLAASGDVDVAISLTHGLDAYDLAGGVAILRAVGGDVVDIAGRNIDFRKAMQFNGCVAGRPELLRQVVDRRPASARTPDTSRARVVPAVAAFSFVRLRGAQGAMLGQLAGDSLGSLVEFHGPEQIRAMYPEGVRNLEAGGVWNLLPGQPTDDSEMALVLARSIVEEGRYDPDAAAEAYIGWMQSGPFDIGTTTTLGIRALQGYGRPDPNSQSNGGLMRVAPIGIFAAGNPAQAAGLARLDTGLTHPNPVCLSASAAFCAAISVGIDGADHGTMVSVAHVHAGDDEAGQIVRQCLEQSLDGLPTDFTRQMGWVLIALSNAFHRLWHGQPIENALIETVGQGGDTDTNAAICGALLGAAQGRDAVPLRWRRSVMACRSAAGSGARHVRPAGYWPDDCIELAESLMEAGSSRGDRPRP